MPFMRVHMLLYFTHAFRNKPWPPSASLDNTPTGEVRTPLS